MGKVTILVETQVKPGKREEVVALLKAHAGRTLDNEPGCLQFDVVLADDDADRLYMIEVYADEAARAAHLAHPRLLQIRDAQEHLIVSRRVMKGRIG